VAGRRIRQRFRSWEAAGEGPVATRSSSRGLRRVDRASVTALGAVLSLMAAHRRPDLFDRAGADRSGDLLRDEGAGVGADEGDFGRGGDRLYLVQRCPRDGASSWPDRETARSSWATKRTFAGWATARWTTTSRMGWSQAEQRRFRLRYPKDVGGADLRGHPPRPVAGGPRAGCPDPGHPRRDLGHVPQGRRPQTGARRPTGPRGRDSRHRAHGADAGPGSCRPGDPAVRFWSDSLTPGSRVPLRCGPCPCPSPCPSPCPVPGDRAEPRHCLLTLNLSLALPLPLGILVLRGGLVRGRPRGREPCPVTGDRDGTRVACCRWT
jgi:hypothetical protein